MLLPSAIPGRIAVAVLLALAGGLVWILALPPLLTPDSLGHWLRTVQIAEGRLVPDRLAPNQWGGAIDTGALRFGSFVIDTYRQDRIPDRAATRAAATGPESGAPAETVAEFSTAAAFPPLAYLPQGLGLALGRAAGLDWLAAGQLAALANLLVYLALTAASLALLPGLDRTAAALAATPFAVSQAASVSADPLNSALPMLLFALCWHARGGEGPAGPRLLAGLALLFAGLALLKPTCLVWSLLALLIPAHRFGGPGRRLVVLGLLLLPATALMVAWTAAFPFQPGVYFGTGADPAAQLGLILADPQKALGIVADTAVWRSLRNWYNANAMFGPGYRDHFRLSWLLPALTLPLFTALAVLEGPRRRDLPAALLCLAAAALYCLAVLLAFWLTFTPPGDTLVRGMQGRYFWTAFLLGFAALGLALGRPVEAPGSVAAITGALWGVQAAMLATVIVTYGTPWGILPAGLP